MNFNFREVMKSNSTEELVKIATTDRNNYQDEAVFAAEKELSDRKYSSEEFEKYKIKGQLIKELEFKKSIEPLEIYYKIIVLLFPGIITLILSGIFKNSGYDKKSSDLILWTIFGFVFYGLLSIILHYL